MIVVRVTANFQDWADAAPAHLQVFLEAAKRVPCVTRNSCTYRGIVAISA